MSKKNKVDNLDISEYQGKKLIAFDLYGTCIHRPEWFFGWEKFSTYKELRKEVIRNLWKISDKQIKEITKELFTLLQTQETNVEESIELKNWVKISLSENFIKKINDDVAWVLAYKDFFEVVKELKKRWYKIAAVSNLWKKYWEPLKNGTIPEWIFDYEVLSYKVWALKPHSEIFEYLKQQVEWVDFDEMVFVWDNLNHDIKWSRKVWMKPIHIDRKHRNVIKNEETDLNKEKDLNKENDWIKIKYIQIWTLKHLLDIFK